MTQRTQVLMAYEPQDVSAIRQWHYYTLPHRMNQRTSRTPARSGRVAVVIVQQAAQGSLALDLTRVAEMARLWADQLVRQTLVIALALAVAPVNFTFVAWLCRVNRSAHFEGDEFHRFIFSNSAEY